MPKNKSYLFWKLYWFYCIIIKLHLYFALVDILSRDAILITWLNVKHNKLPDDGFPSRCRGRTFIRGPGTAASLKRFLSPGLFCGGTHGTSNWYRHLQRFIITEGIMTGRWKTPWYHWGKRLLKGGKRNIHLLGNKELALLRWQGRPTLLLARIC